MITLGRRTTAPLLVRQRSTAVRFRGPILAATAIVLASAAGLILVIPGCRLKTANDEAGARKSLQSRHQTPDFLNATPGPLPLVKATDAAAATDPLKAQSPQAFANSLTRPATAPGVGSAVFYVDPTQTSLREPEPRAEMSSSRVAQAHDHQGPDGTTAIAPLQKSGGDVRRPASRAMLMAGDVISGALVTAINSDLPGIVVAQVVNDVFDHATGRIRLIPMGARLVGRYDNRLSYGQNRAVVLWNRIIMPDGRSVDLGSMEGSDDTGQAGLADRVDSHIGPIMRAIALSTAITVGGSVAESAAARSSSGLVVENAAGGVATHATEVGGRFVDKDLNRQPTVLVRQGWPVTVVVNRDLQLEPY